MQGMRRRMQGSRERLPTSKQWLPSRHSSFSLLPSFPSLPGISCSYTSGSQPRSAALVGATTPLHSSQPRS